MLAARNFFQALSSYDKWHNNSIIYTLSSYDKLHNNGIIYTYISHIHFCLPLQVPMPDILKWKQKYTYKLLSNFYHPDRKKKKTFINHMIPVPAIATVDSKFSIGKFPNIS